MIPKGFHKFAIAQLEKAAMTPVKDELCANCGRPYREHLMDTTQCFEGQEGKWFPGSIAEAIVSARQQAPQVIYGTNAGIPEDLQEAYDHYRKYMKCALRVDDLIERIARAEGSLRQAGFTNSADGFLWIPPVNEMATRYYSALNEIDRLKAYLNPIQLEHFDKKE